MRYCSYLANRHVLAGTILLLLMAICFVSSVAAAPVQGKQIGSPEDFKTMTSKDVDSAWKKHGFEFPRDWKAVTSKEDAEKWGREFEQLIAQEKRKEASAMIDLGPLTDKCLKGLEDKNFQAGFAAGSTSTPPQWVAAYADPGCDYTFLRAVPTEFGAGVLMRMYRSDSASNYFVWRLQKDENDKLLAVDVYILISGEAFSDTLRRLAILSYPKGEKTIMGQLFGTDKVLSANQSKLLEFFKLQQSRDRQGVLDAYKKLPVELQREKFIMLIQTQAAMQIDDQLYFDALKELQKYHNGDVSVDFSSIDFLLSDKKFDEAEEALDRVVEFLGDNGHLSTLRAAIQIEQGKTDAAIVALENGIKLEPKFETPYWVLITLQLEKKNFPAVTQALKKVVDEFNYDSFDFSVDPTFAEYVKSPEHDQFVKYIEKSKK